MQEPQGEVAVIASDASGIGTVPVVTLSERLVIELDERQENSR